MTSETLEAPALYIVATPIGNLEDITLRAKRVLETCDLIAAEDTRVTAKLLKLLNLPHKKLISFYDQIEKKKSESLIKQIKEGKLSVALVSDAGTPLISDPGYHLTNEAHKQNVPVIPIPGPSSLTALVSSAGLPSDRLLFLGFLPKKKSQIQTEMTRWASYEASVVFFESAKRITSTVEILSELYPEAQLCLGRELTKLNETIKQGSCSEILPWLQNEAVLKGELAVMINLPKGENNLSEEEVIEQIKTVLAKHPEYKTKQVVEALGSTGLSSKELYNLVLKIKK